MYETAQGIPNVVDLTHPQELMQWGLSLTSVFFVWVGLTVLLGLMIALLTWVQRGADPATPSFGQEWLPRYGSLLQLLQHTALILVLITGGFFLCSTLANRYHNWEQAKVATVVASVEGERLEQYAPQVFYQEEEPYTEERVVGDKLIELKRTRVVDRPLDLTASQIEVTVKQSAGVGSGANIYQVGYAADYEFSNPLPQKETFYFQPSSPVGYTLLQSFRVEQAGTRLEPRSPGDYTYPFQLDPGVSTRFRLTYQAQGGPRWVYVAYGKLLSRFRLSVLTDFAADFASGVVPSEIKAEGTGRRFTWVFEENVSVLNPFGVFTPTQTIRNTGILPRFLLLAPGVFVWWILVLYLSVPLTLKQVAVAGGVCFASVLSLTYCSRLMDPALAWVAIGIGLGALAWKLGRWGAVVATLAGLVIPVFGLLVPYSGLTLSLAGLLSALWIAVRHWGSVSPTQP